VAYAHTLAAPSEPDSCKFATSCTSTVEMSAGRSPFTREAGGASLCQKENPDAERDGWMDGYLSQLN
jgi:hypothetical protein